MGKSWLYVYWHQAVSSLLPLALASVHLFPSCLSSCVPPCETNPKGWRAGTYLGHFPAGLTGWWRHAAKVHHFTWTLCLPGFTLSSTMAFGMGLSTLPQGQPALPRRVSGKSSSWSMTRVPSTQRPSTPGCLEPNLCPETVHQVPERCQ